MVIRVYEKFVSRVLENVEPYIEMMASLAVDGKPITYTYNKYSGRYIRTSGKSLLWVICYVDAYFITQQIFSEPAAKKPLRILTVTINLSPVQQPRIQSCAGKHITSTLLLVLQTPSQICLQVYETAWL